ncbi:hypothetical protein GH733_002416 [Mirounga leonina]|nr:hypothetical protein GH733_002416 [Mirounga leonina]
MNLPRSPRLLPSVPSGAESPSPSAFSARVGFCTFLALMIATPLKPGIYLSSETSSQRRNTPMHAIFFDSIPAGTLTPVKDLAKYQNPSLTLSDHKKNHFLEVTNFNNKNIFHSTMLAEATTSNSSLNISAIKPNKDRLKNKANYESPGKIFQRMKEKVLRDKQEQASGNCSLLEPPKSEKKIFTPKGAEKRVLQHTYVCKEKENNKSSQSDNKAPFLNQEHENVSAAGFSSKALPRAQLAKQILHSRENTFVTTKSKKDTFVLEGIDSVIEKSQNTTVDTLNTNCVPVKNGQSMVSDNKMTTERTSQQEINENTMPRETDLLGSMNDTCKIVLATPRFHITIPRKSKRNASNHSPPNTLQTLTNGVKNNKVVQLQEWMIKIINNNTAICVEGKLTDIPNIYWHSNVIIERIKHNRLRTLSGNIYILKGMIDRISMKEAEVKNAKRGRLPGATELNVCHGNCQNKPPLSLPDDQVNNTFQNGGGNDLSNQRTEESNVSVDILTSRQLFFSDEERKHMAPNQKEAYILVTPLKSKKVIEQKCMKYNLSYGTIKAVTDFAVPKHQKESKSDLNGTAHLSSKPTKTFQNAFEYSVDHKNKKKEDCSECDLVTVNQKIKISSPKKEQTVTSDFKKNTRLFPKLKKIRNASMSFYEHQSSSDLSSEESETEEGIRKKAEIAKKTRVRNTKETVVYPKKSTRTTAKKIPVISESETEESESEFYIKQKKARCSAKENLQKSGIRNESPIIEAMGSNETNRHSFECFPGIIQDEEWNEKELQKLHCTNLVSGQM